MRHKAHWFLVLLLTVGSITQCSDLHRQRLQRERGVVALQADQARQDSLGKAEARQELIAGVREIFCDSTIAAARKTSLPDLATTYQDMCGYLKDMTDTTYVTWRETGLKRAGAERQTNRVGLIYARSLLRELHRPYTVRKNSEVRFNGPDVLDVQGSLDEVRDIAKECGIKPSSLGLTHDQERQLLRRHYREGIAYWRTYGWLDPDGEVGVLEGFRRRLAKALFKEQLRPVDVGLTWAEARLLLESTQVSSDKSADPQRRSPPSGSGWSF